jgi:hypothetical protein
VVAGETSERWRRIAALFDEALKLVPEHRPEYLESACAGDVDLYPDARREILRARSGHSGEVELQPADPDLAETRKGYAALLRQQHRYAEVAAVEARP